MGRLPITKPRALPARRSTLGLVRPVIEDLIRELLSRHRALGRVDLDDIAEVIGSRAVVCVSYEETEHIVASLEAEGLRVGEPLDADDIRVIQSVIGSARRLQAELRRRPTVDEIAAACGHAPHTVRRALEHGRRAARPHG
jgi:Sigma-70 region 3